MPRVSSRRTLACVACLAGLGFGQANGTEPKPGFAPVRRAVYGLSLESDGRGTFRLVKNRATARQEVLVTGKREACEASMIETLEREHGKSKPNLPLPTFGGKQLWADELVFAGWRIQQNHYSKHHRLLDPKDVRRAWGSFAVCRVAFERARIERKLRVRSRHAVVLLHGMGRSRGSFSKLAVRLRRDGYEVIDINYPSTRRKLAAHAAQIGRVLGRLEGVGKVSFVTHSMGGLVARELLARKAEWTKHMVVARLVMLGTPNRGSVLADKLRDVLPFKWIAGDGGQELVTKRIRRIPIPKCEFGVIAGGTGTKRGLNPMLAGDNDGIVTVANTKLDGMADFLRVRSLHTVLMNHPDAIAAIRSFLKVGNFGK